MYKKNTNKKKDLNKNQKLKGIFNVARSQQIPYGASFLKNSNTSGFKYDSFFISLNFVLFIFFLFSISIVPHVKHRQKIPKIFLRINSLSFS